MDKETQDSIKKSQQLIDTLKKTCNYTRSLQDNIKEHGFLTIDEKSYRENLKNSAVLKSNLLAHFSNPTHLDAFIEHGSEKAKQQIFTLAKEDQLNIQQIETDALNYKEKPIIPHGYPIHEKTYDLNTSYNNNQAEHLKSRALDIFSDIGNTHFQNQVIVSEVIEHNEKTWESKQRLSQTLSQHFGNDYDHIWQEIKHQVKNKEAQVENHDNNAAILFQYKNMGKDQQVKFFIDENKEIARIQFIPELKQSISQMRDKILSPEPNQASIRHIV